MWWGKSSNQQREGILPYTEQTRFNVADAYATGGQVVPADQVPDNSQTNEENQGNWQDNLDRYGEQAKDGLRNFGDMLREGVQGIGDATRDLWRRFQGE